MHYLKSIRWLVVLCIIGLAVFYLILSAGNKDKAPFLRAEFSGGGVPVEIVGEYKADIVFKKEQYTIKERFTFTKAELEEKVKADVYHNATDSSIIDGLKEDGWKIIVTDNAISAKKDTIYPYLIGITEKTKRFRIPLLMSPKIDTTNENENEPIVLNSAKGVKSYRYGKSYYLKPTHTSIVRLKVGEGQIIGTFPNESKKDKLYNEAHQEQYTFADNKGEADGGQFSELANNGVLNVEVLNSYYNNPIGKVLMDWSPAKIIAWGILAIIGLLADKVKEKLFAPLINRFLKKEKATKK